MKIATLGPKGTFSEIAARQYNKNSEIIFLPTIREIFESVEKNNADEGIVPIENLLDGSIGETLDSLNKSLLNINEEIIIPIHHVIASLGGIKELKIVMSHQKALAQCSEFIKKHNLIQKEFLSTAEAMKIVAENKEKTFGAIGAEIAAREYGLKILQKNIEDNHDNVTRFIVISRKKSETKKGNQKTSIVIIPNQDRPGLLFDLLKAFAQNKINLTKIESRPSKLKLGEYVFYIDFEGHEEDKIIKSALYEISKLAKIKIFGSYTKKY